MTIRSTWTKSMRLAVSLVAGMFVLAAASHGTAATRVGAVRLKPAEAIVHTVQGRPHDRGTLFRPPENIKPPPGPRVPDNRGDVSKFVRTCGHHPRPCEGLPRK